MVPDAANASQCRQTLREHNESCHVEYAHATLLTIASAHKCAP